MRPNIFKFATSELSQDAFLCYVLDYYKEPFKEEYPLEYQFSKFFINKILEKIGMSDLIINSLEIKQQFLKIDILLIINKNIYVIIEDKTFTSERKNQMKEYKEKVVKHFSVDDDNVYCIFYKTGDESYKNIFSIQEGKNTKAILREEIIEIFENYRGTNILFHDYLLNLKDIQRKRDSFKRRDLRTDIFTWDEIIGFYNELDKIFILLKESGEMPKDIEFNWEYTSNPSGGFMCYYFQNVLDFSEHGYYLQLESKSIPQISAKDNLKLVFKVWSDKKDISLLYKGLGVLKENYGELIIKPSRFSSGRWMTQAIIKDYLVFNEIGEICAYETAKNIVMWLKNLRSLKDKLC